MNNVRGNPERAEQTAHTIGKPIPAGPTSVPAGSDRKSQEIQAALRAANETYAAEVRTWNTNLEQVRRGLAESARRYTVADKDGAETVEDSTEI